MLDLKYLRDNAEDVIAALHYRQDNPTPIKLVLMRDAEHRRHLQVLEAAQSRRNEISAEIGKLTRAKGDSHLITALRTGAETVNAQIEAETKTVRDLADAVHRQLAMIPNLPLAGVPLGPNADYNVEISKAGKIPIFDFPIKQHFELGEPLGMDFETGSRVSGSRYVFLKREMARLERALGQFMIDFHTTWNGYTEVSPPYIVNEEAMFGTGQLPKFAEDLYRTNGNQFLIPTAEVSLTNMVRDSIVEPGELGRFCALTPCFRAEAGSAGKDTRGLIRQHQFHKVELVSICSEMTALHEMEHERMLGSVEHMLDALGLPYRVMVLCTGDMGFSARKTYDIEVWLPGQNTYREISSISYCGDFQGRRMNARYRIPGEKGTKYVHTFNGSGVAVGRALVAVLENYQNADGSITIPKVLRPYMGIPMALPDDQELIVP